MIVANNFDRYVDGAGYGQNIAAGVKGDNVSAVITELFYNGEERAYADAGNYGKGTANEDSEDGFNSANFEVWGHMTQMVWSNTTTVGCVTKDCSAQGLGKTGGSVAPYFTVCNYYPQGMSQTASVPLYICSHFFQVTSGARTHTRSSSLVVMLPATGTTLSRYSSTRHLAEKFFNRTYERGTL